MRWLSEIFKSAITLKSEIDVGQGMVGLNLSDNSFMKLRTLSFDEFFEWPFSVLAPSTSAPRRRHFSSWEPYIVDQGRRKV